MFIGGIAKDARELNEASLKNQTEDRKICSALQLLVRTL